MGQNGELEEVKDKLALAESAGKAWEQRAKYYRARCSSLEEQNQKLMDTITRLATRDPVIIKDETPWPSIIKELGEALAKPLIGREGERPVVEGEGGARPGFSFGMQADPEPSHATLYPEFEFDPSMEPVSQQPTRGGWVGGQVREGVQEPPPTVPTTVMDQVVFRDGQVFRRDGQPLFRSGVGAPPPQGGVE